MRTRLQTAPPAGLERHRQTEHFRNAFEHLYDDGMVANGDVSEWWAGHQRILNARAVPERFTRCEPIPVRVRLRWADDGVQHVDTTATAWTTPLVLIQIDDPRSVTRGVWVPAADVTRLDGRAGG